MERIDVSVIGYLAPVFLFRGHLRRRQADSGEVGAEGFFFFGDQSTDGRPGVAPRWVAGQPSLSGFKGGEQRQCAHGRANLTEPILCCGTDVGFVVCIYLRYDIRNDIACTRHDAAAAGP